LKSLFRERSLARPWYARIDRRRSSDNSWDERSLTWNTRRDLGAVLGRLVVRDTTAEWFEVDVTAFVRAEQQAGHRVVSVALRNVVHSSASTEFASRESGAGAPQLLIRP
jgi:hypothetical protein